MSVQFVKHDFSRFWLDGLFCTWWLSKILMSKNAQYAENQHVHTINCYAQSGDYFVHKTQTYCEWNCRYSSLKTSTVIHKMIQSEKHSSCYFDNHLSRHHYSLSAANLLAGDSWLLHVSTKNRQKHCFDKCTVFVSQFNHLWNVFLFCLILS